MRQTTFIYCTKNKNKLKNKQTKQKKQNKIEQKEKRQNKKERNNRTIAQNARKQTHTADPVKNNVGCRCKCITSYTAHTFIISILYWCKCANSCTAHNFIIHYSLSLTMYLAYWCNRANFCTSHTLAYSSIIITRTYFA